MDVNTKPPSNSKVGKAVRKEQRQTVESGIFLPWKKWGGHLSTTQVAGDGRNVRAILLSVLVYVSHTCGEIFLKSYLDVGRNMIEIWRQYIVFTA